MTDAIISIQTVAEYRLVKSILGRYFRDSTDGAYIPEYPTLIHLSALFNGGFFINTYKVTKLPPSIHMPKYTAAEFVSAYNTYQDHIIK